MSKCKMRMWQGFDTGSYYKVVLLKLLITYYWICFGFNIIWHRNNEKSVFAEEEDVSEIPLWQIFEFKTKSDLYHMLQKKRHIISVLPVRINILWTPRNISEYLPLASANSHTVLIFLSDIAIYWKRQMATVSWLRVSWLGWPASMDVWESVSYLKGCAVAGYIYNDMPDKK